MLEQALDLAMQAPVPNYEIIHDALQGLAWVASSRGEQTKVVELRYEAFKIASEHFGPDDPETLPDIDAVFLGEILYHLIDLFGGHGKLHFLRLLGDELVVDDDLQRFFDHFLSPMANHGPCPTGSRSLQLFELGSCLGEHFAEQDNIRADNSGDALHNRSRRFFLSLHACRHHNGQTA